MKKRSIMVLAICILAYLCSPLFASGDQEKETDENEKSFNLITSTSQLPGASTQMLQEALTKVFAEQGDGSISFKHYNSATLFKSSAEPGALLDGNIDVGYIQLGYFYDNGANWANMFDAAFLFTSVDSMMEVLSADGEIGKSIQKRLWDQFHVMAIAPFFLGTRNVWLSKNKKVVTPSDLAGTKIRMPNSASFLDMGHALNAEPTPLDSSETYLAMQTGTVDAQENIVLSSWANGMQEVTKTIILTKHMITANYVCINGDVWESMSVKQQQIFTDLVNKAVAINNAQVIEKEEAVLKECQEKYGITLQVPDIESFKKNARDYYLSNKKNLSNWDLDQYEAILKMK